MFVDTSFVVELLRERSTGGKGPATSTLEAIQQVKLQMPLFVLCELHAGVAQAQNPKNELEKLELLLEYFETVYPGEAFATTYGELELYLRKKGTPIPLMDLLIVTLVKCHGVPILTRDIDHFECVPGIVVERF
jgi:tRNA(fMet)-specific endonuclease VapC